MQKLINISSDPLQNLTLILPDDAEAINLVLRYSVINKGWFVDIKYAETEISNRRVFASPNILHQWKNILPFGLGCFAIDGEEPYFADDFKTGRCGLLLLNKSEVSRFSDLLSELKKSEH